MSFVNIISALGNNNSVYPLIVRDCGIENFAKCIMTYKQNAKESKFIARQATRERIIDEYGTSAVWLGGIPLMKFISDKIIDSKGLCSKVDIRLFNETKNQGLNLNIKKFTSVASSAVSDLVKIEKNKNLYKNLQVGKFFLSTAIPIAVMGFLLPKFNFSFTKKKMEKLKKENNNQISFKTKKIDEFLKASKNDSKINFCGVDKFLNLSDVNCMMILDGGLTAGRIKTSRNKKEKCEMAFKMAAMFYLNYFAPKKIDKFLNNLTKKIFGLNTSLDVKTLSDKNFLNEIKSNLLKLPEGFDEKSVLDFIDNNPNSSFVEQIKKMKLVSFLENNIRDPRKYVEVEKINSYRKAIDEFSADALNYGSIEKYAKKAFRAKSFNVIANVIISSFLLAVVLPKLQFLFRKITTGSNLDPGIVDNDKK